LSSPCSRANGADPEQLLHFAILFSIELQAHGLRHCAGAGRPIFRPLQTARCFAKKKFKYDIFNALKQGAVAFWQITGIIKIGAAAPDERGVSAS